VHRDLKPANIKVMPDGKVKVLDFGLAKAMVEANPANTSLSNSPTLSLAATNVGVILGTASYMSPEQAKGRTVDRRTDIFAFGCVLFEMLAGKPVFDGEDLTEILGRIVTAEPDWSRLPGSVSPRIRELLRRCLKKDRTLRLRDAGDAGIEIMEATSESTAPAPVPSRGRRTAILSLAGLAVAVAALAVWNLTRAPTPGFDRVARLTITLPPGDRFGDLQLSPITFSPDGTRIAYVARHGGSHKIFLRSIDTEEVTPVSGTEGGKAPFFSPDGQSLGFFTRNRLKTVSLSGGTPRELATAVDAFGRGGSWGEDGSIVFSGYTYSGLSRVSTSGGMPTPLTTVDSNKGEGSHRFPHHLPGGKAVLFTVGTSGRWDDARIEILDLDTKQRKLLFEGGSDARYVPTGHIVFMRAGTLMAVPFDLDTMEATLPPVPVVPGVMQSTDNTGVAHIALSNLGWLAYVPGEGSVLDRKLTWVDRKGAEEPLPTPARPYFFPSLSPNDPLLLYGIDEGNKAESWIYDLTRGIPTPLLDFQAEPGAIWTPPDGKRVTANTDDGRKIFWKAADNSASAEVLTTGDYPKRIGSWSPDGQILAYEERRPDTGTDIAYLSLKDNRKQQSFLQTPNEEINPTFSPNGRWLAYASDESGHFEIYVRPFPPVPGENWQVSTEGGMEPVWARDGGELFYRNGDKLMAAPVLSQTAFRTGPRCSSRSTTGRYTISEPTTWRGMDGSFSSKKRKRSGCRCRADQGRRELVSGVGPHSVP
jgi:serine/threonine-protein kinase